MLAVAALHTYADESSSSAGPASGAPTSDKQQSKAAKAAANRALSRKVRATLAKDKNLDITDVTVRARDGAVTLQGTVPDQSQTDRAAEVAKGVDGVTSVKNALSVRAPRG
jgi:hyperosmotically inducible periplasmic protein